MNAPQSVDEIGPVVAALKGIDHLLDIIWNPKAFMIERGSYSVLGHVTPPKYAGRWQVIRYETPNLSVRRDYCVICTVTEPVEHRGILCLQEEGPYMPIGWWLVDFMQRADSANTKAMERLRAQLWAEEELLEHATDCAHEGMAIEALDHVHFDANYAGGVGNWQGKGADFTPTKE